MGGSSSTSSPGRRISLEQDADGGVVKVSEDVLRRMFGEEDSTKSTGDSRSSDPLPRRSEARWKARMDELEDHYREKLRNAEEKSAAFYKLTAEQFQKAADEVEAKFMKQRFVPICENLQNDVLKCYAKNPNQTLNCAQEVKAFNTCIEQARMNILLKRGVGAAS
ncbi:MICOS complex subunit MIC19-like isoform X1 [Lytechinus pictus]|uniref:MICOS complex subunit MIC19-like isoform X1 n=1 Tax=Lytechinus pictus TaxID=7653 RepID=UPI00240E67C3|nr:MICOS complex subunit MIC19-like [Lytechinus pictus]